MFRYFVCIFLLFIFSATLLAAEVLEEGAPAPGFSLENISGEVVELGDFQGKVVLLNLWATWCVSCMKEMASFERLHQLLESEGLRVVAISVDPLESREKVEDVVKKQGLSFPILLDPEAKVARAYGVTGYPETFFIGPEGRLIAWKEPTADGGKKRGTLRVIADRPWDSPLYYKNFAEILKSLLKN